MYANDTDLNTFYEAYVTAALWSSFDDKDRPLDENYGMDDLTPEAATTMRADCAKFIMLTHPDLADLDAGQCGHDLWLTRNHHGAGFWSRGYAATGDRLTKAAEAMGEQDLYVTDENQIDIA